MPVQNFIQTPFTKEMPLKTIVHQELISSACRHPTIWNENPREPTCPHLDNARLGSEAKQKVRTLDVQAEESLSFEPPCTDAPKRRNSQMIGQRDAPEMQSVDCSGLWPKKSITGAELDSLIGSMSPQLHEWQLIPHAFFVIATLLGVTSPFLPCWLCRGFLSYAI